MIPVLDRSTTGLYRWHPFSIRSGFASQTIAYNSTSALRTDGTNESAVHRNRAVFGSPSLCFAISEGAEQVEACTMLYVCDKNPRSQRNDGMG
mmetsp:Transcript_12673/g.28362  ORF Transcript_12673/g.28362 Transcript_12673/m.28362 type:complete len:93 (+) Transcript_12673:247-525(+)